MIQHVGLVKASFLQLLIDISQIYRSISPTVTQPRVRKRRCQLDFKVHQDQLKGGVYNINFSEHNKPGIIFQALHIDI